MSHTGCISIFRIDYNLCYLLHVCFQKELSRLWKHPSVKNHLNHMEEKLGLVTNGLRTIGLCIQSHMYLCRDMGNINQPIPRIRMPFMSFYLELSGRGEAKVEGTRSSQILSQFYCTYRWQA